MKTVLGIFLKATTITLMTIVAADLTGFMLWALMGQTPVDDVYIGTITTHVVQYFAPMTTSQPK